MMYPNKYFHACRQSTESHRWNEYVHACSPRNQPSVWPQGTPSDDWIDQHLWWPSERSLRSSGYVWSPPLSGEQNQVAMKSYYCGKQSSGATNSPKWLHHSSSCPTTKWIYQHFEANIPLYYDQQCHNQQSTGPAHQPFLSWGCRIPTKRTGSPPQLELESEQPEQPTPQQTPVE